MTDCTRYRHASTPALSGCALAFERAIACLTVHRQFIRFLEVKQPCDLPTKAIAYSCRGGNELQPFGTVAAAKFLVAMAAATTCSKWSDPTYYEERLQRPSSWECEPRRCGHGTMPASSVMHVLPWWALNGKALGEEDCVSLVDDDRK